MTTDPALRDPGAALLEGAVIAHLDASDDQAVLAALADSLTVAGRVTATFADAVRDRERRFPTGLPTAVPCAIPHTDADHVLRPGLALATLAHPVSFGLMGGTGAERLDVELVVMLVLDDAHAQVGALQHLIARLQDVDAVRSLLSATDEDALRAAAQAWLRG